MKNKILFEAGSTKTTVLSMQALKGQDNRTSRQELFELTLPGYNPNRPSTLFEQELETLTIGKESILYFYGSGLHAEANKLKLKKLFKRVFDIQIQVFDDVLGAARAAFQDKKGIVGIMGTGAVVALYDGTDVQEMRGGWGYLIDDLGGGYELGKVIVSAWLNQSVSIELDQALTGYFECNRADFIHHYYSDPQLGGHSNGLKLIAGVVPVFAKFQTLTYENEIISEYLKLFFSRHVRPLSELKQTKNVRFIGSVAKAFEPVLYSVMSEKGIVLEEVIQFPAKKLWDFHFKAKE